jgi:hypothetical protein
MQLFATHRDILLALFPWREPFCHFFGTKLAPYMLSLGPDVTQVL